MVQGKLSITRSFFCYIIIFVNNAKKPKNKKQNNNKTNYVIGTKKQKTKNIVMSGVLLCQIYLYRVSTVFRTK